MERKIVLEIEELEERIAPHAYLGMGEAEVRTWQHGGTTALQLPAEQYSTVGTALVVNNNAWNGLAVASDAV